MPPKLEPMNNKPKTCCEKCQKRKAGVILKTKGGYIVINAKRR